MIHYEEALYQVCATLPFTFRHAEARRFKPLGIVAWLTVADRLDRYTRLHVLGPLLAIVQTVWSYVGLFQLSLVVKCKMGTLPVLMHLSPAMPEFLQELL